MFFEFFNFYILLMLLIISFFLIQGIAEKHQDTWSKITLTFHVGQVRHTINEGTGNTQLIAL